MRRCTRWFKDLLVICAMLFSVAMLTNCGWFESDDSTPLPPEPGLSGKVVQGAVSGATVWADHKIGAEANFKRDASEQATASTTKANGTYTLASKPSYDYVVVSTGGTDTLTNRPAQLMLAPSGSSVVSTATTAVVLDPAMAQVFTNLGIDYKQDISQSVTPAAAILIESIQVAVDSLTSTLNTGGNTLKIEQINTLQRTAMTQIVSQIKSLTAAEITTAATLTSKLQAAVKTTLDSVDSTGVIDIATTGANTTTTLAAAIVPATIVTSVVTAVGSTSTTGAVTEPSLFSSTDVTNITTTASTAVTTAATQVTVTAPSNSPPTISGTPGTSVTAGTAYSFKPTASDPNNDTLIFSINKSTGSWASFNTATGELKGTPGSANVGTISDIIISVSDGIETASLPSFNLTVNAATGTTGGTGSAGGTL